MQKKLVICSKSTEKFSSDFFKSNYDKFIVSEKININLSNRFKNKYDHVVAIGGGACIDLGKLAAKSSKNLTCFPTTAAGACRTSHSVVWDESRKLSIKTVKPSNIQIVEKYFEGLPFDALRDTFCDAVSHNLDVLYSYKATEESNKLAQKSLNMLERATSTKDIIIAGNIAGDAIELTPTTLLHSLSYPMTDIYNLSHGEALGIILKKMKDFYNFDIEKYYKIKNYEYIDYNLIVEEAYKYEKIKNFNGNLSKVNLKTILI